MFQIHFKDYGNTDTKYCYIKNDTLSSQLHVVTLCMRFSPLDNKLLTVSIPKHRLAAYPELRKAINETLLPLLKGAHKSNVENIIIIFMIIYVDVK